MPDTSLNCPSCGAALSLRLKQAKLVACDHCGSAIMLEDAAVRLAGKAGVMADMPSLLRLGETFVWHGRSLTPIGQVRFDYAHGWWDEFWAVEGGDGLWVSVDEGDIAIEEPAEFPASELPPFASLSVGAELSLSGERFVVSEIDHGVCAAVRGELPEALAPGDAFDYAHLSGPLGRLVTLEYDGAGVTASEGRWIDPFEIAREIGRS